MRKILMLVATVFVSLATYAQNEAETILIDLDNGDLKSAYSRLSKAFSTEKGRNNYKNYRAKGEVYTELAKLKYQKEYSFKASQGLFSAEDIEAMKNYSDEPLQVAYESFKKCMELDVKGKSFRKMKDKIQSVINLSFNQGKAEYDLAQSFANDESKKEEYKRLMNRASGLYEVTYNTLQIMPEKDRELYYKLVFEANDLTYDLMKLLSANSAFLGEDFPRAEMKYNELAQKGNDELTIYRDLSTIYVKSGQHDKAKKMWSDVNAKFPGNADFATEEAIFYQSIGETEVLMNKLDGVIELDPKNSTLYNVQAKILVDMILAHNNELAKNKDEEKDTKLILSDETKTSYYNKAESRLTKSIELKPESTTGYNYLGILYYSEGLNYYNQKLRVTGASKADIAKMKELNEISGSYFDKAIAQYDKALEQDQDNIEALSKLQEIYGRKRDSTKSNEYKKRLDEVKAKQKN